MMGRGALLALAALVLPLSAGVLACQDGPSSAREEPPAFDRPEHVRGIYLNAWTAGSEKRITELLAMADTTEINTFVIDLKDASGYVSHATRVPLAVEVEADGERRIGDLRHLLKRLRDAGVYPIARIVVGKDPRLTSGRPDLAIQDSAGGPWSDDKGNVWANPYSREVWQYQVDLAREVAGAGFPEIQWDYVRFPDAAQERLDRARYPGADGRIRADAIRGFLDYAREELSPLGVTVTADVFGVTTSYRNDVGIGQLWERLIDVVDVALPMVYPSHYGRGSYGFDAPNAHPYEVVYHALEDARKRSAEVDGAGAIRPWLQDFSLGEPPYGAAEVRAQIQAAYDAGIQEWILWNPASRYTAAALAPEDAPPAGWDPYVRVAGTLAPASKARSVMERASQETRSDHAGDSIRTSPRASSPPRPDPWHRRSRRPSR